MYINIVILIISINMLNNRTICVFNNFREYFTLFSIEGSEWATLIKIQVTKNPNWNKQVYLFKKKGLLQSSNKIQQNTLNINAIFKELINKLCIIHRIEIYLTSTPLSQNFVWIDVLVPLWQKQKWSPS